MRKPKITESKLFIKNLVNCSYLSLRQKLLLLTWVTTEEVWLNITEISKINRISERALEKEIRSLAALGHLHSLKIEKTAQCLAKIQLNGTFIKAMVNKSDIKDTSRRSPFD